MTHFPPPEVSIVIVSYNTRNLLRECLETVRAETTAIHSEIIVVDNDSRDGSAEMVQVEFPGIRLIQSNTNLGFAAANNRAFEHATGRYVVLLNSDAFFTPGSLQCAIDHMNTNPQVGLGGGKLVGLDQQPQPSARAFPSPLTEILNLTGLAARYPKSRLFGRPDYTWQDLSKSMPTDWLPGAFLIIRRDVLETVGYFDEDMYIYYEEVDLCRRVKKAGHQIWYWPDIVVIHIGGESSKTVKRLSMSSAGSQLTLWRMRSEFLYYRKHHGLLGAWMAKQIEKAWHNIRAFKNKQNDPKREESETTVSLLEKAWAETKGGRISPARPW